MTKTTFFWGIYDGNDHDEMWKVLHDHFEKLARRDDDAVEEAVVTDNKAVDKR
jgi:hypothetical protein